MPEVNRPAPPQAALEGLGARFDHVAHASRRIRDLLPIYQELLGGVFIHGGANHRMGYRTVQLAYSDGTRVELLEPLPESSFLDSFLRRNPDGGLHHVTFKVKDVRAAIAGAEALGLRTVGTYLERPQWQEVFLHPKGAFGALVQIVQTVPGYPPVDPDWTLELALGETRVVSVRGRADGNA